MGYFVTLCFCCFILLVRNGDTFLTRDKRSAQCESVDVDITTGSGELQLETETYNGVYNDTEGNLVEYTTNSYKVNEKCEFLVYGNKGTQMVMTSEYFAIEDSENCMFDYLEINDNEQKTKFCGWKPLTYISTSEIIDGSFISDESYEDRGYKFYIKKQTVDESSFCNNTILGDGHTSKTISNSVEGTNCFYRIQAEGDKVVQLTLQQLNFGARPCSDESVIIYEGVSTHGKKLMEICSDSTAPSVLPFHAHAFFIEYRNPLENELENAFKIQYDFVDDNFSTTTPKPTTPSPVGGNNDCSGRYIDLPDGNLTYKSPYQQNNKDCVIVVRNTLLHDHVVQVKFEYFEIEESDECMFDSLKIFSGERKESPSLGGLYCGDSLDGRIFISSGNSLRLEFKTDESFALRGFKAVITFEPAFDCTCDDNRICVKQGYEKFCVAGRRCNDANCQSRGTCIRTGTNEKCYCETGFGGDDCSEQVDGKRPLRFRKAPQSRNIQDGNSINPDCQLDVPDDIEVHYEWTFDGEPIGAYSSRTGFGYHPGGLLAIDTFSEENEGQYACIAVTVLGTAEHTFNFRMVSNCEIDIYPGPGSALKNVGQSVLLPCNAKPARQVKHVTWKKDGIEITSSDSRFEVKTNNYLQISDLRMTDKGTYSCHAEDFNGCSSSKKGTLTVLDYQPINKYCGISTWDEAVIQARLSKGQTARVNEHPWYANFRTKETSSKTFCGGSLISRKFVLTAAHCIKQFDDYKLGPFSSKTVTIDFGTTKCTGGGTQRTVGNFTVHPNYNKITAYDNDIAIVELDSPVEYGDSIRPICLAEKGFIDETFLEKHIATNLKPSSGRVAGCGQKTSSRYSNSKELQVVHLPYVSLEACDEAFSGIEKQLTDSMYCAGSKVARTGDACQGDSGSGFLMATEERWILTGIVSYGVGCDMANFYGVYTHVGLFYDWIKEKTKFDEEQVENFLKERD